MGGAYDEYYIDYRVIGARGMHDVTESDIRTLLYAAPDDLRETAEIARDCGNTFMLGVIAATAAMSAIKSQEEHARTEDNFKRLFPKEVPITRHNSHSSDEYNSVRDSIIK